MQNIELFGYGTSAYDIEDVYKHDPDEWEMDLVDTMRLYRQEKEKKAKEKKAKEKEKQAKKREMEAREREAEEKEAKEEKVKEKEAKEKKAKGGEKSSP